ncbi:iron-sulfur cluster biosynthesis family protein [Paenibacillus hunanensis]|uniref:iron-sulfur cluster biosynthesis family protein n=1 Tax=Paenibacillus hunanensis TaxID=539262 RepID=UPI002026B180|nr:iron-sulfur cluster biosynthesis family protein [Paenibacillus hunanensis]MCL9662251.1 iron-sulfur cluster biosynthesis family protein [Paenibacillus hunanensis]
MRIQVTELADRKLRDNLAGKEGMYKLLYDTGEGCGCDGIPVLLIVDRQDANDEVIETNSVAILIDRQHQTYFEALMSLDAEANYTSFKLRSDSMTYSSNVKIRDLRGIEVPASQASNSCALR